MYICNENVKILNELPMKKWNGTMCVDRLSVVGMNLSVEYWGKIYKGIKILEHIKGRDPKFKVAYDENEFEVGCCNFLKGQFGKILGKYTNEFKVEIGQIFKDKKRDLTIINREYRKDGNEKNWKYYKYKCNKCGYDEGWIAEDHLLGRGSGCSCCVGRTVILGINTIWDTARWMVDLGVSEEDAKKYTKSSNKKVTVNCPDCGKYKSIKINHTYTYKSIFCNCGDGTSYPEKIVTNLLQQLNLGFTTQLSKTIFEWCESKKYDFYVEDLNMIIETHGGQHYRDSSGVYKRTLLEEQENDKYKKESALSNGVANYIELDCRESDLEYIKNSMLNSKLNELFDLSNVDWNKCEEFALKNMVKTVCDYWNQKEEWETTKDLEIVFKIDRNTIIRYLKKGTKLGWCDYDPKEELRKAVSKNGKLNGKKVEIFKDGLSLGIFESASELERQSEELFGVKLTQSNISKVCTGKQPHYKGYTFN